LHRIEHLLFLAAMIVGLAWSSQRYFRRRVAGPPDDNSAAA
jgi:hypothetical protein